MSAARSLWQCKNRIRNVTNLQGHGVARVFSQDVKKSLPDVRILYKKDTYEEDLRKAKPYEEMPKIPMIPILGSAWAYLPIIGKYSSKRIQEADILKKKLYGDVVRERFGKFELVSSYDPETMITLEKYEGLYPARSEFSTIKAYREKRKDWFKPLGLVVLQGEEWQAFRKRIQKYVASSSMLANYLEPMDNVSRDLVGLIRAKLDSKGEVDDILKFLHKWAFESIAYVSLDTRFGCLDPNLSSNSDGMKMIDAVHTMLACINVMEASSGNYPFWRKFSTPTWRKFVRASDVFTMLAFTYIRNSLTKCKNTEDMKPLTILQKLLIEEKLDVTSTMVAVSDFIMAGIDTTSHASAFVLYNLARNPREQEKAYKEIMQLLPNKEDRITEDTLKKLVYVTQCIRESLRLHPVVRGNLRILDCDVVVNGYRVPANTAIISMLQVIYRDEKYFKNADQFIPERWNKEDPLKWMDPLGQRTFRPFGHGSRSCIGQKIATQEMLTLIVQILRNYSLEYHYEEVGMFTRLLNIPDRAIKIRFIERMDPENTRPLA